MPVTMKRELILLILLFDHASYSTDPNEKNVLLMEHGEYFKNSLYQKAKNKLEACLTIKVNKHPGSGDFATVQSALNSVQVSGCRVVISIGEGIYSEKIEIPATTAYISLEGVSADKTIIEWNDTADAIGQNGQPLGTYASATFAVNAPYFIAKNITFKNSAPQPPSGAQGKQAVALRVSGDAAAFIRCKIIGAQDTLYDHMGRHYFKDCYIQGSVDFIFGNGLSLYKGCHLHAIPCSYGALTAQKRDSLLEETGFSFVDCNITGSAGSLYLGRAWGSFSRVVFADTYMDEIVSPRGWHDWGVSSRTVFYGEYQCWGPGAGMARRVPWSRELSQQEAEPFMSLGFIDGYDWLTNLS